MLKKTLIAGALIALSLTTGARAEYPEKPIEMILPWPALATSTDIIARKVAEEMTPILGQAIKVVNRPGGAAVIGTAEMVNARPDGYTVGGLTVGPAVSQVAAGNTPYGLEDLKPVGLFATLPFLIAARADAPFNDIASLAEWSNSSGEKPTLAHWGKAAVPTLATYRLAETAGFTFNEVAYTNVDTSQLLNGEADIAIVPLTSVLGAIRDGSIKPIVALTPRRLKQLPDLPTVSEAGGGSDVSIWTGLFVPEGTPDEVVAKLHAALVEAVGKPSVQEFADESGMIVYVTTPEETAAQMQSEFTSFRDSLSKLGLVKK